jgi:methylmalonyl-CoA/ethylmalonyl-CoA epimerase
MLKVEHIGIAVLNLEESIANYEKLLNTKCHKIELVESQNVRTAFFYVGPNKIELLESTTPNGVIAKYIAKKGEGIHHIAYDVKDIDAEMLRLKTEGYTLLNETPTPGADNKLVCFIHPKDTNGVLMELCMEKGN